MCNNKINVSYLPTYLVAMVSLQWFRCIPYRHVGRPVKRWEDDILEVAGGGWADEAQDFEFWQSISAGFTQR